MILKKKYLHKVQDDNNLLPKDDDIVSMYVIGFKGKEDRTR